MTIGANFSQQDVKAFYARKHKHRTEKQTFNTIGARAELMAASWLMKRGWLVFRNLAPYGPADLIIMDVTTGRTHPIDVKTSIKDAPQLTTEQHRLKVKLFTLLPTPKLHLD